VDNKKVKLLFGAGNSNWHDREFQNVDVRKLPHIDVVCNVARKLPWEDDFVDEIYAESVLEHIPMGDKWCHTIVVLNEWNRVLKPGGFLTIKIPDMETLCNEYKNNSHLVISYLYGMQNYSENIHVSGFSINGLKKIFYLSNFHFLGTNKKDGQPWEIEILGRKKTTNERQREIRQERKFNK